MDPSYLENKFLGFRTPNLVLDESGSIVTLTFFDNELTNLLLTYFLWEYTQPDGRTPRTFRCPDKVDFCLGKDSNTAHSHKPALTDIFGWNCRSSLQNDC